MNVVFSRRNSSTAAGPVKMVMPPRVGELVEIDGEVRRATEVMWHIDGISGVNVRVQLGPEIASQEPNPTPRSFYDARRAVLDAGGDPE